MNATKPVRTNCDTRHRLTRLGSELYDPDVTRQVDIRTALQHQLRADVKRLHSIYNEQNKLRPKVIRYRDLEDEAKARTQRLKRTAAVLGNEFPEDIEANANRLASGEAIVMDIRDWRNNLALWEAIISILEHVPEMQIVELHQALGNFGFTVSRQAVESAVFTHQEVFESRLKDRERFVSLKK